jgi:hypothetical protein
MNAYDGAYKVSNKDWEQSLPEIFDTFGEAFDAAQAWDAEGATIEMIEGDSVEVVWSPDYNNFVCDNIFVLNRNTL